MPFCEGRARRDSITRIRNFIRASRIHFVARRIVPSMTAWRQQCTPSTHTYCGTSRNTTLFEKPSRDVRFQSARTLLLTATRTGTATTRNVFRHQPTKTTPPNGTRLLTLRPLLTREFESFETDFRGAVETMRVPFGPRSHARETESRGGRLDPTQSVAEKAETQERRQANRSAFSVNRSVAWVRRTETSSPGRTRTYDPAVNSRLLYQLSYRGSDANGMCVKKYGIQPLIARRVGVSPGQDAPGMSPHAPQFDGGTNAKRPRPESAGPDLAASFPDGR